MECEKSLDGLESSELCFLALRIAIRTSTIKRAIKLWNQDQCSLIHYNIQKTKANLERVLNLTLFEATLKEEKAIQIHLNELLAWE